MSAASDWTDSERSPRAQANAKLAGGYEARVLEPSPPAVEQPPWFADDPVARDEAIPGRRIVSPVATGDVTWAQLAAGDAELAAWCAERWLGPYRRLGPAPAGLVPTRLALHRLAEHVIAPARRHANGKIGLRYTRGGFGTPFFGNDLQVRVEDAELVVSDRSGDRRAPITTLAAAADHLGREQLPAEVELDESELEIDRTAAIFLGEWYGFAASVLEALRAGADRSAEPSRVQLWPEHFDLAIELGADAAGARAAYGLSPGDEQHPEPYAYVAPWIAPPAGELWQASSFNGAELSYGELLAAGDQRTATLEFLATRLTALSAGG